MNEKEYLTAIVTPLLSKPEEISVGHSIDEKGVLLTLKVSGDDMGRIIGKGGITANSIRNLMRQYGSLNQKHIAVKIAEPEE